VIVKLAPRVILYPAASAPPAVPAGCLALPQFATAGAADNSSSRGLPSAVFGYGSHPTTRLCAAALDQLCLTLRPQAVLDVGTGTGVLARIAHARGTSFVVGTDIDPAALARASAHAALDASAGAGAGAINFTDASPDAWGARFDIVLANILEGPLLGMAQQLVAAMRPGAALLLSGFTRPQAPALKVRFVRTGLSVAADSFLEDWVLLHFASPRS
jgi:ribosomal protein L11 methyltransferase